MISANEYKIVAVLSLCRVDPLSSTRLLHSSDDMKLRVSLPIRGFVLVLASIGLCNYK